MHALLGEMFTHQAWADLELLRAVSAQPQASSDEVLIRTIHHIVVVQRVFTAMLTATEFDMEQARKPVESLNVLQEMLRTTHADLSSLVDGMSEGSLGDIVKNPRMPDLKSTVGETLMHVVLHSQGHRGQCLMRLRELTGSAPILDFLMWVKLGRPRPALS